jgi:hypothetical protein
MDGILSDGASWGRHAGRREQSMKAQLVVVVAVLAGCAASSEERRQEIAKAPIEAARERALTQWKCSEVTGTVLGRTALPMPASYAGPERIQYTVGVEGCGKSMNVVVVCAAGTPCFVAGTDSNK